jgi:hypothetical protein
MSKRFNISAALNVSYGQGYFLISDFSLPTFFLDRGGLSTKPFAKTLDKKKRRAKSAHKEISIERNRPYTITSTAQQGKLYKTRYTHIAYIVDSIELEDCAVWIYHKSRWNAHSSTRRGCCCCRPLECFHHRFLNIIFLPF